MLLLPPCFGTHNLQTCQQTLVPAHSPRLQYLLDTSDGCKLVSNIPWHACKLLTDLAIKITEHNFDLLRQCYQTPSDESCKPNNTLSEFSKTKLFNIHLTYQSTPLGVYTSPAVTKALNLLDSPMTGDLNSLESTFLRHDELVALLSDETRKFIYPISRMNIMLHANMRSFDGDLPHFHFTNLLGTRWEVAAELLADRPAPRIAEIGVFRGDFSEGLLSLLREAHLFGFDPYFGNDGTFPLEFSESNPEEILQIALRKYEKFPENARLYRQPSREGASNIPDNSLDLVFIDGCHELACVQDDIDAWLPKLKKGGLMMGHDYSERWPDVMTVVNSFRPNQDLFLGSDLTWWFFI